MLELMLGTIYVSPVRILSILVHGYKSIQESDVICRIVIDYRIPRAIMALALGVVLGISGTFLQASLRNPLAEPYLLGIAGGAAFGTMITYILIPGVLSVYLAPVVASIMGIAALLMTLSIARFAGFSIVAIALAGISVTTMFHAINSILLMYFYEKLKAAHFWLFGTLSSVTWRASIAGLVSSLALVLISLCMLRCLNALIMGDEVCRTLGVDPLKSRYILLASSAVATSIVIAYTGPIGFVGLVAPHIARLLIGHDHRYVIPLVLLISSSIVLSSDLASRLLIRPSELPIGSITASFGVPFFLYLLVRSRGKYEI